MQRHSWRLCVGLLFALGCLAQTPSPSRALTWQETEDIFRANNPTLLAGKYTIDESRADEITAYLRPNPNLTLGWDQLTLFSSNPYRPIWQSYVYGNIDYLHEREHKRELRLASAKQATEVAVAAQSDLERTLLFNLRDAFVRVLQSKAIVELAKENLAYYDKEIAINQERFKAGDIAKVDFQRLDIQRIQYQSDLATAEVNLRTAKIDLEALIRDRRPQMSSTLRRASSTANPQLPWLIWNGLHSARGRMSRKHRNRWKRPGPIISLQSRTVRLIQRSPPTVRISPRH